MGLLNYTPELDPNGQQVNRTAAMGNGVVNPGVPATEPVYYGDSADPKKKRKVSPWAILGAGLLGGVWSQHNPQGFDRAMGQIGQGLQHQQELELKRQQEAADQAWRKRQEERWQADDRFQREKFTYEQGQDEADRKRQAQIDADTRARYASTDAEDVRQFNARQAADAAKQRADASQFNAKEYGTPFGTQGQVQGAMANALNAALGIALPQTGGLLPQVQPQQMPAPPLAQSYVDAQTLARDRDLRNKQAALNLQFAPTMNAAKLAHEQALTQKAKRPPASRSSVGSRAMSRGSGRAPAAKPTTMTEREAARLAAAYPGQPPKVAKQLDQEGFAAGLPFDVARATKDYWTEDMQATYPTQFKYDQDALEVINASVASGLSKTQTMKRLADAGLLVKTLIGSGTQVTARQNYEKIYDWIMKANGKTAPIPNFSRGGPFTPEDDMRKLAEQRVNGL